MASKTKIPAKPARTTPAPPPPPPRKPALPPRQPIRPQVTVGSDTDDGELLPEYEEDEEHEEVEEVRPPPAKRARIQPAEQQEEEEEEGILDPDQDQWHTDDGSEPPSGFDEEIPDEFYAHEEDMEEEEPVVVPKPKPIAKPKSKAPAPRTVPPPARPQPAAAAKPRPQPPPPPPPAPSKKPAPIPKKPSPPAPKAQPAKKEAGSQEDIELFLRKVFSDELSKFRTEVQEMFQSLIQAAAAPQQPEEVPPMIVPKKRARKLEAAVQAEGKSTDAKRVTFKVFKLEDFIPSLNQNIIYAVLKILHYQCGDVKKRPNFMSDAKDISKICLHRCEREALDDMSGQIGQCHQAAMINPYAPFNVANKLLNTTNVEPYLAAIDAIVLGTDQGASDYDLGLKLLSNSELPEPPFGLRFALHPALLLLTFRYAVKTGDFTIFSRAFPIHSQSKLKSKSKDQRNFVNYVVPRDVASLSAQPTELEEAYRVYTYYYDGTFSHGTDSGPLHQLPQSATTLRYMVPDFHRAIASTVRGDNGTIVPDAEGTILFNDMCMPARDRGANRKEFSINGVLVPLAALETYLSTFVPELAELPSSPQALAEEGEPDANQVF